MTMYTMTGFTVSSDAETFLGTTELTISMPDSADFSYLYSGNVTIQPIGDVNFVDLEGPLSADGYGMVQFNSVTSGSTQSLWVVDLATETVTMFFIGGPAGLPTSQASYDAYLATLNPNNPIQTVSGEFGPGASLDVGSFNNTTTTEKDFILNTYSNTDDLIFTGIDDDNVYSGAGNDSIYGGDGDDRLVLRGDNDGTFNLSYLYGGDGDDVLKVKLDVEADFYGGAGNDRMIGAEGVDFQFGGEGVDTVIGLGGDDVLRGGIDDDFNYGGRGNDTVYGEDGDDVVRGNRNNDLLFGGEGSDRVYGGGNNDEVYGGEGRDYVLGDNGNDTVDGGLGNDNLTGGAGADVFVYKDDYGYDKIVDFESGVDRIDLSGTTGAANISDTANGAKLDFGGGNVILVLGVDSTSLDADDFIL